MTFRGTIHPLWLGVIRADISELLGHKLSLLLRQHILGMEDRWRLTLKPPQARWNASEEPGLLSILTASLARAGPAFLTSDYLLQSNPMALSVCSMLCSSLEIMGMLPERTGPSQGLLCCSPTLKNSLPRGPPNTLISKWVMSNARVSGLNCRLLLELWDSCLLPSHHLIWPPQWCSHLQNPSQCRKCSCPQKKWTRTCQEYHIYASRHACMSGYV